MTHIAIQGNAIDLYEVSAACRVDKPRFRIEDPSAGGFDPRNGIVIVIPKLVLIGRPRTQRVDVFARVDRTREGARYVERVYWYGEHHPRMNSDGLQSAHGREYGSL